jgi:aspartyl-tRNA(Asn)/glutamyl-tRNA(Gln) amidotransferase subunit C
MSSPTNLSRETVLKVAHLAKISISETEADHYQEQFDKILSYFTKIAGVSTDSVEPLVTPVPIETLMREDVVVKENTVEEILQNAPATQGNLFKVPPVV